MEQVNILAIESSCDDTSAAVLRNGKILANVVANQEVHKKYGGVVPEWASRKHQENIVPVVDTALKEAGLELSDLTAIAVTQGPGLLGSLLVGVSYAKSLSFSLGIPLIGVDHLDAHVSSHFIDEPIPSFPFLCLLVSGGHTKMVKVEGQSKRETIGRTLDDAAGEAFDKAAKMLGLDYPGGPLIETYAQKGDPHKYYFSTGTVPNYDYSFSGLKTGILVFLKKKIQKNPNFIEENLQDLCASIQKVIVNYLLDKFFDAAKQYQVKSVGIAGGVSANVLLRSSIENRAKTMGLNSFVPQFQYCTDNAAMIAIEAFFKWKEKNFSELNMLPYTKV